MTYCLVDELTGRNEHWTINANDVLSFARQVAVAMVIISTRPNFSACLRMPLSLIVLQPNSDLGVEHAWESAQSFRAVFGTKGPTYSESGSCHSGTLGKIEKFKMAAIMAAANVKNYKIVTTLLLIHLKTCFLHLGNGFGTQAT